VTVSRVQQLRVHLSAQLSGSSVAEAMPVAEDAVRLASAVRHPDDCIVMQPDDEDHEGGVSLMLIWQDAPAGVFGDLQSALGDGWRPLSDGGMPVRDVIVQPEKANCGTFRLPGVSWALLSEAQVERIVFALDDDPT
jgi:hypothetical protein